MSDPLLAGVRAVVFDAVGTLLFPEPAVWEVYADAAKRFGADIPADVLRKRLRTAYQREEEFDRDCEWATNENREYGRWQNVVTATLVEADVAACFRHLYDYYGGRAGWRVPPEAEYVLSELVRRGFVVGMASNFDARLTGVVDGFAELAPLRDRLVIKLARRLAEAGPGVLRGSRDARRPAAGRHPVRRRRPEQRRGRGDGGRDAGGLAFTWAGRGGGAADRIAGRVAGRECRLRGEYSAVARFPGCETIPSRGRPPMPRPVLALVAALVIAPPAFGCTWDYDTLLQERSRFPDALELITGKFLRHSPEFYEWRIKDRLERLKGDPANFALLDDLGVAYDKIGRHDDAIETMEKAERLQPG